MLYLDRRVEENIVITLPSGEVIKVKVCEIRRYPDTGKVRSVRLGVDASPAVKVLRKELVTR